MLRLALTTALVLAIAPPAPAQELQRINTCFVNSLAALRLSQAEQGIAHCDKVIEDQAAAREQRGQALAQRGLMQARRWTILLTPPLAVQAISDITESFELHAPAMPRKHQLLMIRAQLYAATGQARRAADDYGAILHEDPNNAAARQGRGRLGPAEQL